MPSTPGLVDSREAEFLRRIERQYETSAFVSECCLIAGPADGEAPPRHLVVVPDDAALRARRTIGIRDLLRFELETCGVALLPEHRISGFDVSRVPLPRASGEIDRREVQRRWRQERQAAATGRRGTDDPCGGDIGARLADLVQVRRPGIAVDDTTHLDLDLGLESLERVEMLFDVERITGVTLDADRVWEIATFGDLVAAVRSAPSSPHAPSDIPDDPWQALLAGNPRLGPARGTAATEAHPVRGLHLARQAAGARRQAADRPPRRPAGNSCLVGGP